jgi:hypothetical protein
MQTLRTILTGALLAACIAAQAQTQTERPAAKTGTTKTGKPAVHKTQERILLEQLDDKFSKLDELNRKYDDLQQKYDALQQSLTAREARLDRAEKDAAAAQADAAAARQKLEASEQILGVNGSAVTTLQNEVAGLRTVSTSLTTEVQAQQQQTAKLAHPEVLRFKGIDLTPGGFLAGETVDRQRAIGGDINTAFSSIPFTGLTAARMSEFNATGRQSRISLLAEGKTRVSTLRGYYEADFLSSGTTSNDNQSNSYTLRQRQVWAQAALPHGWTLTSGQMWSLATEYGHGLDNLSEAVPLTIDPQYNVGFTWERQYGFRVVKRLNPRLWLGWSVEEPETLSVAGHNLPTLTFQEAGNSGGLYNSTANYSFNYAPDLLAKAAFENNLVHAEVFGIGRFFRDRVYPNGPALNGSSSTTSALGAYTSKAAGGGLGANARFSLFDKTLVVGAHGLFGDGIGRYSTALLPDATAHPSGSLELLTAGSALATVEWHPELRLDLYSYYGGEYVKRAYYLSGETNATTGQPILTGYGAPTNVVTGCYLEQLPSSGLASGASSTTCQADNRNIQEGTAGYWFRFYRGSHGALQQGIQYSYVVRHTWQGIGNPAAGETNSPKAIDNMWFTSFRYYLPH